MSQSNPQPPKSNTKEPEPELPCSYEAEDGLLNLAAGNSEMLYRLEEAGVTEKFFFSEPARYLFGLLRSLTEDGKGKHPGEYHLIQRLAAAPNQEGADYLAYYRRITGEFAGGQWFDKWLGELTGAYQKRRYIELSAILAKMAYDPYVPADACTLYALGEAEAIDRATNPLDIIDGPQLAGMMRDYYQNAAKRQGALEWGIADIDQYTGGGSRLGEYTIVRGEPGSGKSALLQQTYLHRAYLQREAPEDERRAQVWITVADMSVYQVFNRMMQQQTGVSAVSLSQGRFDKYQDGMRFNQWHKVEQHLSNLEGMPWAYIHENDSLDSSSIRRVIKTILRRENAIDVYVDYLQQLADPGEVYERTRAISRNLLHCVRKLRAEDGAQRVGITAISSVNKQGQMAGAKELEHDADNVFVVDNPMKKDRNRPISEQSGQVTLHIEKQRNGPCGKLELFFKASEARFYPVAEARM